MRNDLRQLTEIIKNDGFTPNSLVEIGSLNGNDMDYVKRFWGTEPEDCYIFEGHPTFYKNIIRKLPDCNVYNYVVTNEDVDEIEFNCVTESEQNKGISSVRERDSNLTKNAKQESRLLPATRMDTFMQKNNIKSFDVVKIDAEGYGYEVLKSFGDEIKNVAYIQVEVETKKYWINQHTMTDVEQYMESVGFELISELGGDIQKEFLFKNTNRKMRNISIVIPSYNNLRHLKNCYHSIRRWYSENEIELIILDDASTDGTWEWLNSLTGEEDNPNTEDQYDYNLQPIRYDERLGHTILYDVGIEEATNDIVGIIHADMLVTKNTFENMLKHLKKGRVVCSTRIEPPLHPDGDEKIIKDFGQDFDTLDVPAFEQFAQRMEKEYKNETTNGMFAPWILYKEDYQKMGGHDHIFAPFPYEDSDIFQRWVLEGYDLIQARDSFVYHLTCRGHKWNEEVGKLDDGFEEFEERARKNFIRKWGNWIENDSYQHPVLYPKYDIGFVVHGGSTALYQILEPWCSDMYIESFSNVPNTIGERDIERKIIEDKFHLIKDGVDNDVVVELDGDQITNDELNQFVVNVNKIIMNYEVGTYEWNGFNIDIKKKEPFKKEHFEPIYKKEVK